MGSTAYRSSTVTINSNVGNVTDSYKNVWNNCEISVSDEKRQILEWLSPLAPRERHRAVSEARMDGIGNWFLRTNDFEKWRTGEDRDVYPVLFCYGDPGVGKTHLSSLVIDTLCDSINGSDVAVACMYCDFHAGEGQSVASVLAALLKQLVAGMEPMPQGIVEAFEQARSGLDGRTLRLPKIRAMLAKSLSSLRRGFICIDALDEFPTKHRPELWNSLRHIVLECPNTRLFITGRPHIGEEVKNYLPGYPDLAPLEPTKEDIREYIIMRLGMDTELDAMDLELEAEILRIIPDRISGVFLLVSLIMDAVLEDATIHQGRQTLRKMINGFGLDDAYSTTLSRIRGLKGTKGKLGIEALMWISRSERPLKAEELCHALAVEVGTADFNARNVPPIRTLLSCTLGLAAIDEKTSAVRLIHYTFQEYLVSHPNLFIKPHSMMAEVCLTYLNFRSICELSTTLDTIPSTTPFLHYASCYWGFHARKEMTDRVKHLAIRHLQRDTNHISADVLLREPQVCPLEGRPPDPRGFTGLHCAAYFGITEIAISMLRMKRWDLNGRDSNGATPLLWATRYQNFALAELLLGQGDIDPTLSDNFGETPLSSAAGWGHEGVVKLLLEREDVNPDSPDRSGVTPLSLAASWGHEGVVKILLECRDVDPNSTDERGVTPLSSAAYSGFEGVVKILLARDDVNPDPPDEDGATPLSFAAQNEHEGVMKIFLEREDVNPDSLDVYGRAPLWWTARFGCEGVVKVLLERYDVNPDSPDNFGWTPLQMAAEFGHEHVVEMLLKLAAVNPDRPDPYGRTPLSYAAGSGFEGVVNILLERGDVNPDSLDADGRTPLSYAAQSGHEGVVEILLEREDVDPGSSDRNGITPLTYATGSGNMNVVRMLLERRDSNASSSDRCGPTQPLPAPLSRRDSVMNLFLESAPFDFDAFLNIDVTQGTSPLLLSALEEVELGLVSQPEDIASDTGQNITEATSLSHPDKSPPNQLETPPSTSVLPATPTSNAVPDPTTLNPSGPLKRDRATPPPLPCSKRPRFPHS